MSDKQIAQEQDTAFSYGVSEMRQARAAQKLSLQAKPKKPTADGAGADPYNTSGSFDRKLNWARVGKR